MNDYKITSNFRANANTDLTNKEYVDTTYLALKGGIMTGNITMNDYKITSNFRANANTDLTNKEYVDTTFLALKGGNMTGNIIMNDYTITSNYRPIDIYDLTNKEYADTKLSKDGGTITGNLTIKSNLIFDSVGNASIRSTSGTVILDGNVNIGSSLFIGGNLTTVFLPTCSQVPVNPNQLVNKTYADTKLSIYGGTLTGNLIASNLILEGNIIGNSGNIFMNGNVYVNGNIYTDRLLPISSNLQIGTPGNQLRIIGAISKGSLLVGDGTNTSTLLVGNNNQILKVDNTTATGLIWADSTLNVANVVVGSIYYPTLVKDTFDSTLSIQTSSITPFYYNSINDTLVVSNLITTNLPICDKIPVSDNQLVNKKYIDTYLSSIILSNANITAAQNTIVANTFYYPVLVSNIGNVRLTIQGNSNVDLRYDLGTNTLFTSNLTLNNLPVIQGNLAPTQNNQLTTKSYVDNQIASNVQNINTTVVSNNQDYFIPLTNVSSGLGNVFTSNNLKYNPSTNLISAIANSADSAVRANLIQISSSTTSSTLYTMALLDPTQSPYGNVYQSSSLVFNPGTNCMGIGTYSASNPPNVPLSINSAINNISISCSGAVQATSFITTSDIRIKTNITELEPKNGLNLLRLLQPKTFNFKKDTHSKQYGFIAQEVIQVIPEAVHKTKGYVDNFMVDVDVRKIPDSAANEMVVETVDPQFELEFYGNHDENGNTYTTDQGLPASDSQGNQRFKIKIVDSITQKEVELWTTKLNDKNSFYIQNADQILNEGRYFLIGQEVDDFHAINKDFIHTIGISALQEIDKNQQEDQLIIANLEKKISELENKFAERQSIIDKLLNK